MPQITNLVEIDEGDVGKASHRKFEHSAVLIIVVGQQLDLATKQGAGDRNMETVRHDYLIVTHYLQQNLGRVVGDNGIIPMMDDQLGDVEVGLRAIERPGGFNILSQA